MEERDLQAKAPGLQISQRRIRARVDLEGRDELALRRAIRIELSPRDNGTGLRQRTVVLGLERVACDPNRHRLRWHRRSEAVHRGACTFQALECPCLAAFGRGIGRAAVPSARTYRAGERRRDGPQKANPQYQQCGQATHVRRFRHAAAASQLQPVPSVTIHAANGPRTAFHRMQRRPVAQLLK